MRKPRRSFTPKAAIAATLESVTKATRPLAAALFFTAAACSSAGSGAGGMDLGPAPGIDSLNAVQQDLVEGSHGDAVRAVNAYLTRFGYFPNADLAQRYPSWRPLVALGPTDPAVFDAQTTAAVSAFQVSFGLPQTGVVDDATRTTMTTPRFDDIPEGLTRFDSADKFDVTVNFSNSPVTWAVIAAAPPLSLADTVAAVNFVTGVWANETNLSFAQAPLSLTTTISIGVGTCPPGSLGCTTSFNGQTFPGGAITLSNTVTWTPQLLNQTLLHEFGHALGLFHSSFGSSSPGGGAVMYPSNLGLTTLNIDDRVAVSINYDQWMQLPAPNTSGALDVGVGADGSTWIVAGAVAPSTVKRIYKFNGVDWRIDASGGGGLAIAVSPLGVPWVVGQDNVPYQYTTSDPTTGHFVGVPGVTPVCATDIGVGGEGSVWIVGCTGSPDHPIYKHGLDILRRDIWTAVTVGAGVRIAVGPTGIPWVTNSAGKIYRLSTTDPTTGTFQQLSAGLANDIGLSPTNANLENYAWQIGTNSVGSQGDFGVFAWDEQPAGSTGNPLPRLAAVWLQTAGGGVRISVDGNGNPWLVNASHSIYKRVR